MLKEIIFSREGSNTIVFRTPILVEQFYFTKADFIDSGVLLPSKLYNEILKALECSCVRLLPQDDFDKKFKGKQQMYRIFV